jgi:DNA modification methylase
MIKSQNYFIVKELIPDEIGQGSILNIFTNNVTAYTHCFHKYPAKFIPHIPKWAINKYLTGQKGKTILDPFCGSGTTLVEGILAGHNVIGIDIDPLSCLIAKVKTENIDISELNKVSDWLVKRIKREKRGEFKPECETIEHWFPKETINRLSIIRTLINQIAERFGDNESIRDIQHLLIICFSSIIRRVSYADNESQKTYVSHTHIKTPEEPLSLFLSQLDLFKERIAKFSKNIEPKFRNQIICSSSTESLKVKLKRQNIDLAITSPPYIKAVDYIYNQMVELFWIGDLFGIQTQPKQNEKKKEYIGSKHFHKKDFAEYTPFKTIIGIKKLDDKIQKVFKTDKKNGHKHAFVTFKYFADIENHFAEISKCLDKGRHYIMVVGDSSVSNISFNTADFLTEIAERNGFKITNKWGYKIKNRYMRFDRNGRGGIIEIDWVLDFVKI